MPVITKTVFNSAEVLAATSNSSTAYIQQTSNNLVASYVATAVNGATTVDCKIQHSPDGTNWYDHTTFTQLVGSDGDEVIQIDKTTDPFLPYMRSVVTLAGGTKAATITCELFYSV